MARDLTDADALIATEVFEDRAAMERDEALPDVANVVELMQVGALPEASQRRDLAPASAAGLTRSSALAAI